MSSVAELLAEARSGIRRYLPAEALARAASGSVLVDLRSHDEREPDLAGGFQAWRAAGLPTMPAPSREAGLPGMGGPDR